MNHLTQITNAWGTAHTTRLEPCHTEIYHGEQESAYNHHPQITSLNSRLYATWSNGYRDEDMTGQRMLLATSDDHGETWSTPRPLVDRQPGMHGYGVVTSEGIHVHNGRMVAYFGYYDLSQAFMDLYNTSGGNRSLPTPDQIMHPNAYTGIMVSDDAGQTWQRHSNTIPRFVPNLCSTATSTGRLILPGNFTFPYTDDPYGIKGWTEAGIPDLPPDYVDDPEGHNKVMQHRQGKIHVCEGSFYELDGSTLRMMLRTRDAQRLAVSESRDNGVTWSEPVVTQYTDCQCRFHFGKLPDGRFFGLTCPKPHSGRTPLVLATSEDGNVFNHHYILGDEPATAPRTSGMHKGGRYGYPSYHIMDNTLFVIYTINKEDVALCRVPLGGLT